MEQFTSVCGIWSPVLVTHDKGDICQVVMCRGRKRRSRDGRGALFVSSICERCRTKLFRLNNPVTYILQRLRRRATLRRVPFSLTAEYLSGFLQGTGYLEGKGVHRDDLQIDRVEIHLGYVPGNLQILTGAGNRRKQHEYDYR